MGLFRKPSSIVLAPPVLIINGKPVDTTQRPADILSQQTLDTRITRWCVFNQLLITDQNGENPIANIMGNDLSLRLPRYIYTMNLKQLCRSDFFEETLRVLEDTEFDRPVSRLVDLHVQLLSELDPMFLNLYIGKLIYALTEAYPNDPPELSWSMIFTAYPYLWTLFPIQRIMRDANIVK